MRPKGSIVNIEELKVGDSIYCGLGVFLKALGPYEVISEACHYKDIPSCASFNRVLRESKVIVVKSPYDDTEFTIFAFDYNADCNLLVDNCNFLFKNKEDADDFIFVERTLHEIKNGQI